MADINEIDQRLTFLENLHKWGMVVVVPAAVLLWLSYGEAKRRSRG